MGAAIAPRRQPITMDRRSAREVLQACVRQAPGAILTPPQGAEALGECPFRPRPFVLWGLPLCRAWLLPDGVEALRRTLWAPRHRAWGGLHFGPSGTSCPGPIGCMGALDAADRRRPALLAGAPRRTCWATWTGPLPRLPVPGALPAIRPARSGLARR